MEITVNTFFLCLSPKTISHKKLVDGFAPNFSRRNSHFSGHLRYGSRPFRARGSHEYLPAVCAIVSGAEDVGVSCYQFDDFSVTRTSVNGAGELTIHVEVLGARTQAIFDDVFDKMVAAAQPIPGFRRVKGGKTPDIPRDILLEVLGPSEVYKQVIVAVMNSSIGEFVEKEGLKVGKDLRIEQSFEDLETTFEAEK
ncbi:hypothetical protein CJ030_MR3G012257 [Morella rubra]|uniref:peptidylprolyl isomerase n=1 Tax=Morella rubra TaxID=262757 RepID=A0A6A1W2M9_9ROSI|nr:hypothetical protein CJ030_MR3G012257 [Morella rubra]